VTFCPADQVPPGPAIYGGLIVGWSAYTHIPTRARRVAFLQALRQRALPGAPVLLSFFTRTGASRYDGFVCKVANLFRARFAGGRSPWNLGITSVWKASCERRGFGWRITGKWEMGMRWGSSSERNQSLLPASPELRICSHFHSGIFPCFFGGFLSRLFSSISSAWISFLRVSRGWMTASTKPRSAAT
jgi:hypothetical protein